MRPSWSCAILGLLLAPCASGITVAEINGNRYFPPFNGPITNLTGLVTATTNGGSTWIRSTQPDEDESTSESIMIFNLVFSWDHTPGEIVTIDSTVNNETGSWKINYFPYRLWNPHNVRVISKGNPVKPVVIGTSTSGVIGNKDMRPPTEQYSILDNGNVFGVPNTTTRISEANPQLQPTQYGMDFYQSLLGELVTIQNVTALGQRAKDNTFTGPHIWVYGNWPVTGQNSGGGLTVTDRHANPETILLFDPTDGSSNPNNTKLGDSLTDMTGIIDWIAGHYYLRPLTAPKVKSTRAPVIPPSSGVKSSGASALMLSSGVKSNGLCNALSVASYNLDESVPGDLRIPLLVNHISTYLGKPSVIFIQGVMDDSGTTDDGSVHANITLSILTQGLKERTGIPYDFLYIDPLNNADSPPWGYSLRSAYLFNPLEVRLHRPNRGNPTDLEAVLPGPSLRFNPGLLYLPLVFRNSPKPLIAHWETTDGQGNFFTVNMDWENYWGSRWTMQADERPPVDPNIKDRNDKANVTGSFIAQILAQDPNAAIIAAGCFHEFAFVEPLKRLVQISGLQDLDVVSGIPEVERYTSTWSTSGGQVQLDHMYVSPSIARQVGNGDFEHIHLNTWASEEDSASSYDPTVARLNVCKYRDNTEISVNKRTLK
ncbi:MAG: hypothetical protein OHK93_006352 [Ramalina farinacea]|uniref:Uncharacterized protein n=1 Tax=Ramalina farinacea TaxID=258253 RepID=A0AA43QK27_9LECA|nr:hypothetical protein [Ramalina farinacea]